MKKIKVNHSGYRIGDMRHRVLLHVRRITSPAFGAVDFTEQFTGVERWAAIQEFNGVSAFDGVNEEVNITHRIGIRHDSTVEANQFVQLADGRMLRIVSVNKLGERGEYQQLNCTERGFDEAAMS